ncbi:MAG: M23 family metallopeptidase [Acutalibacteraceae bacterium]
MGILFKTLYVYISNLGVIIQDIFRSIFKMFSKIFKFNKTSFSSAKLFFKRAVVFLLIVSVVGGSVYFAVSKDSKVSAVSVKIGDEIIGYAGTQSEADLATALAFQSLGVTGFSELSTESAKTEPYNIKTGNALSDLIISRVAPDRISVSEVYIDDDYFCAVTDKLEATDVFVKLLDEASLKYPASSVSFAESVTFKNAYYEPSDSRIWSAEQLELSLRTLNPLTISHAECEKSINDVDYDTVEIQTNTLFIGDTRIRRQGEKGTEYSVNLVTYIGDKKVQSEHLLSQPIKTSVSQIVERGIRAESLSLGTYSVLQTTGIFCWPCVSLYTVTSPFGYRSLGYHRGLDISGADASGSLVVAGASGTVTEAGWSTGGYGNYVIIDHGNGIETLYAHMLDNSLMVNEGDVVTKGQAIGRVGNTGYSFGAHLHFEVRINGNRVNPAPYLGLE